MAQISSDGTEQDSQSTSDQNGTRETEETGKEGQAAPDPKQEPGDNNEHSAEMDVNSGPGAAAEEDGDTLSRIRNDGKERAALSEKNCTNVGVHSGKLSAPEKSPTQGSLASSSDSSEQREGENVLSSAPADHTKTAEKADHGTKTSAIAELTPSDGEPLSRMDSEDSIGSTLMDMESTASSGRSTPAMLNGHCAVGGGGSAAGGGKSLSYTCCWDHCQLLFPSSPDLAEHIRGTHVDGQRGGVFVCLWKGCKVYNTPSTSQSWLQRHMLTHSGDKPFKCVVGGCNATFASQGGLARHVPTHFSSQSSSKMSNQGKVKEESPSKAGLNKRRKLKNKHRRSLPRPHDFFDAQTMDAIRHRAICLNLATHIESLGNGHSVVFHSTVIARRKEDSGKVKVLLHWSPEDILPDVWVNESDRLQQKTQVVHLSKLPSDTAVLLDPNIYR
ncbi:zinc finger protein AEBP2 isoform 2-T2 [Spinachia spinachia]